MADKLQLLEDKVTKVLARLDQIKSANALLSKENRELKGQLTKLEKEFHQFRLEHNDQVSGVRSKLLAMLGRIEELEKIGL
jgi:FtsZ-binding cell division protein ZapB